MGGFNFVLDDAKLVAAVSGEGATYPDGGLQRLVVPGDCDDSRLYHRIWAGEMPPSGFPAPTVSEVSMIRAWIACLGGSPAGEDGAGDGGAPARP
jgi:hypothetical protein